MIFKWKYDFLFYIASAKVFIIVPPYGVDSAFYQTSEVEFKTLNEFIAFIGGVW